MKINYSSAGAPTGQASAQEPQLMHSSALITNFPSPSEMHPTGQASAHAPQAMHSSEILYAISKYLHKVLIPCIFYHIYGKNQEYFTKKFMNRKSLWIFHKEIAKIS
jgi:hypothetical protein